MRKTVKMLALTTGAVVLICSLSGCFLRHTGGTDNPLGVPSLTDIDGDKVDDIDDNDIDGDGIINEQDSDIDGDGKANTEDNDIDGDGIININDNDIDGDGIPNDQDDDIDNDGTANNDDSTPGGTGNQVSGTEGDTNTGSDKNDGTTNTGTDQNTGETRSDDYVSGIGIVAVDTVGYRLTISSSQGTGTVSTREDINLKEVRDVIEDNGIALSTFALADLSIITESDAFVQANRNTRVVITVSYLDESNTKISVLESAATEGLAGPVLTVGDLANGLQLNEELFAGDGFSDFTAMIKDESKSSVSTIVDINFLDAPSQGGTDLDVDFILTAVGKKPL